MSEEVLLQNEGSSINDSLVSMYSSHSLGGDVPSNFSKHFTQLSERSVGFGADSTVLTKSQYQL